MLNLFNLNEKKVEFFPEDRIEAAKGHFNEGWWKGFAWAVVCTYAGIALGAVIYRK